MSLNSSLRVCPAAFWSCDGSHRLGRRYTASMMAKRISSETVEGEGDTVSFRFLKGTGEHLRRCGGCGWSRMDLDDCRLNGNGIAERGRLPPRGRLQLRDFGLDVTLKRKEELGMD